MEELKEKNNLEECISKLMAFNEREMWMKSTNKYNEKNVLAYIKKGCYVCNDYDKTCYKNMYEILNQ